MSWQRKKAALAGGYRPAQRGELKLGIDDPACIEDRLEEGRISAGSKRFQMAGVMEVSTDKVIVLLFGEITRKVQRDWAVIAFE